MKTYFCYLNYFATGEGMTNAMAVAYAENEEDAKKHLFLNMYAMYS